MSDRSVMVEPMAHRPSYMSSPHVRTLATMLEIARIDQAGERLGSRERRKLVNTLPVTLGANKIDDFLQDDFTAPRYQARQLLLTDAIESTSLLNEEVVRTVVAGGEKFKVIRDTGCAMYNTTSNALRVPLGEAQRNADIVGEASEIPDRTQDYSYRDFTIVKYGVKPRISFEMIEDGLVDVVAEEIFYAGAALENKLNYDAIGVLATASYTNSHVTTGLGSGTAGTGLTFIKEAKALLQADGFTGDTMIMSAEFEQDLLANTTLTTPYYTMGEGVVRSGMLPAPLYGLRWFVTDNANQTSVDGQSHPWGYNADSEVAAIVMEAKRGLGIAMRRDRTVKKFDDIVRELHTITATMRCDVNYLHANAIATIEHDDA